MTAGRAVTDQLLWRLILKLTDRQYQAKAAWQVSLSILPYGLADKPPRGLTTKQQQPFGQLIMDRGIIK